MVVGQFFGGPVDAYQCGFLWKQRRIAEVQEIVQWAANHEYDIGLGQSGF